MCDQCGCRSEVPIARWVDEHVVISSASDSIVEALDGGDVPAARARLAALAKLLGPHAELEEATLFTELRTEGELVEDVERLEGEHAGMRSAIAGLAGLDDAQWSDSVRPLMGKLKAHIEAEEDDLFPASQKVLSIDGWQHVAARIEQIDASRAAADS